MTEDELRTALALAIGAYEDALERNLAAERRGENRPVGAGALLVLAQRIEDAEAQLRETEAGLDPV